MNSITDMTYYAHNFINKVLGYGDIKLTDTPGASVKIDPKTKEPFRDKRGQMHMQLPLTRKTLAQMWGEDIATKMSDEAYWTIVGALIFHEMGHIVSPETFGNGTETALFMFYENIIYDCNETTVCPRHWMGSGAYFTELYKLAKALTRNQNEIVIDEEGTLFDESTLVAGSIEAAQYYREMLHNTYRIYRGVLEFKWEDEMVTTFPAGHPLEKVFEDTVPTITYARRYWVEDPDEFREERIEIAQALYDRIKEWWIDEMDQEEDTFDPPDPPPTEGAPMPGVPGSGGSGGLGMFDMSDLTEEQKEALEKAIDEAGLGDGAGDLEEMKEDKAAEEETASRGEFSQKDEEMEAGEEYTDPGAAGMKGSGGGYVAPPRKISKKTVENISTAGVMNLRRYVKVLIQERKLAGRSASRTGETLYPPNFYQIKTDIKRAKIKTDVVEIRSGDASADFVLLFDRSGSMNTTNSWGLSADVARNVMAQMYLATKDIKEINMIMGGYGCASEGDGFIDLVPRRQSKEVTLSEIYRVLTPAGGNDLPAAMKVGVEMLSHSKAKKRYVVLLMDGDEWGSVNLQDVYQWAKRKGIHVLVFGIDQAPKHKKVDYADGYTFVADPSNLPKYFQSMLKDILRK
jgi:Mg-chelatase subunit ChlD